MHELKQLISEFMGFKHNTKQLLLAIVNPYKNTLSYRVEEDNLSL